jgi:two-component system phosphate regulon sensor histidine kinase PhoR
VRKLVQDAKILELIRQMRKEGGRGGRRVVEHEVNSGESKRTYKVTLSTVADKLEHGEDMPANADGEVAGVVAVLHDVTHEREIAQLKNDFVSNVSHELRTPLASIKAYVELLIDGEAQDEATKREFYEVIQNEANRLGRLIDNILNISKIESGLVKVDRKPQSLTVVVKDAIEVILPQAERKRITVREQLTPVFYQASADRDMLYQAVLNLLSNAVKYTPEGGEVRVETSVDEVRRKVITRITDTGVGIPPKDLPFIFDKFYRAEANSRMAPGTGLGLSLVKHIVETVHRGRLFVESQTGKGSCFGFELDLCE